MDGEAGLNIDGIPITLVADLHFHWTATIALDGTTTTTPMVIEQGGVNAN